MKKQRNREGKRQGLWQVLGFVVLLAAVFVFAGAFAKTNVLAESVGEHDLLPYHTKNVNMYNGNPEYTFTMMGEKYTKGFTRTAFYESRLLYNLDGEVSSVFFTVGHLDGGNTKAAGLKVYLDDIYQESYARTLTGDMMNEKITIPTAGVRKLTVIITESDGDYGFANVTKVGAHNYTSRITKAATAKEDGIREYTCEDCGATFAETVPARKDCEPYIFPYQASQLNKYDEEEGSSRYFTIMGNRYYKGFTKISYYTGTALYNLNAEYNSLRFTVGHLDGGDMNSATLRYYVDNVEMGSIGLSWNMTDRVVEIPNLSSARQLKITSSESDGDYAIFDFEGDLKDKTPKAHTYEEQVTMEAQFGVPGIMTHRCRNCGAFYTTNIPALKRSLKEEAVVVTLAATSYTYNGKAKKPAVKVTYNGETLVKGVDYKYGYSSNVNASTAVVTFKGIGNYKDTIKRTFTIVKAKQPLAAKGNTVAAAYSKVKSKQLVIAKEKAFVIKNAQGTLTFKKVAGAKALAVGKTSGSIGVAKGTKKGTYKIKVQITAAGSKNYKKGAKTVIVTVVVK